MTVTINVGAAFPARLASICSREGEGPVGWLIGAHDSTRVVLVNAMAVLQDTGRKEGWLHRDAGNYSCHSNTVSILNISIQEC
jgi:hypothetical protein